MTATLCSRSSPSWRLICCRKQLGVVADTPGPVRTELGQVLADLGRVYAGSGRQLLRGQHQDPLAAGFDESPEVEREASQGRFR